MKRFFFGVIALVIGTCVASLGNQSAAKTGEPVYFDYYFQFIGVRGFEEWDRTKWVLMTPQSQITYQSLSCPGTMYGCKLIATDTVVISGVARPRAVYTAPGTTRPITGTYVSAVHNAN